MEATIQQIEREISGLYPATEVKAFVRIILEEVCGLTYTQQVTRRDLPLTEAQRRAVAAVVERLKRHEPLQYILGVTEFAGLRLQVTPAVLIPRPETEELVQWIAESPLPDAPAILDIGTGSGCIALALKRLLPAARVSGVDISEAALAVARDNARTNRLEAELFQADILRWSDSSWGSYDVVVSNPPYVRESEREAMLPNVLQYEPAGALFVPDDDPLRFYRAIAAFAQEHLRSGGWLFFEINEALGTDTEQLLTTMGFRSTEVRSDLSGRPRMVRCRR